MATNDPARWTDGAADGDYSRDLAGGEPGVRVVVVDDEPLCAATLARLLAGDPRFDVVGIVPDREGLVGLLDGVKVDVAVVDVHLGGEDGGLLVDELRVVHPTVQFVLMTSGDRPTVASLAARAGADGYIVKGEPLDAVTAALEAVGRR